MSHTESSQLTVHRLNPCQALQDSVQPATSNMANRGRSECCSCGEPIDETQQLCLGEADPVLNKEPLTIEAAAAADHRKQDVSIKHITAKSQ